MDRIINNVRGAVILHNFLLSEAVDDHWEEEVPAEGEDDVFPDPHSTGNAPDYARREELYFYLSELEETTIN